MLLQQIYLHSGYVYTCIARMACIIINWDTQRNSNKADNTDRHVYTYVSWLSSGTTVNATSCFAQNHADNATSSIRPRPFVGFPFSRTLDIISWCQCSSFGRKPRSDHYRNSVPLLCRSKLYNVVARRWFADWFPNVVSAHILYYLWNFLAKVRYA